MLKFAVCFLNLNFMVASGFVMAIDSADIASIKIPQQYENITAQIQTEIDSDISNRVSEQRKLIDNEASAALIKISETLQLLAASDSDAAIKILDIVEDKLNEIIKKQPAVRSKPVLVVNVINDYLINFDEIKRRKKEIDFQWKLGHTQEVRRLLDSFVSDTSIRTLSMPVKYFADGIKKVKQLIDQSKITQSKHVIGELLKSIQPSDVSIPLPLFRAELMITNAEQLTVKVANQKVDIDQLNLLMSNVSYQLKIGEALGYGDSKRYAKFYQAIDGIKSLVNANQQTTKLFSKLKYSIVSLKNEEIVYK